MEKKIKTLDELLLEVKPYIIYMVSDNVSAEERKAFRNKATDRLVFYLSNKLYGIIQKHTRIKTKFTKELFEWGNTFDNKTNKQIINKTVKLLDAISNSLTGECSEIESLCMVWYCLGALCSETSYNQRIKGKISKTYFYEIRM